MTIFYFVQQNIRTESYPEYLFARSIVLLILVFFTVPLGAASSLAFHPVCFNAIEAEVASFCNHLPTARTAKLPSQAPPVTQTDGLFGIVFE